MEDGDYLALSGIQHFAFCRRQWGLIHIEQAWRDNALTAAGVAMHGRAHAEAIRERRGDVLTVRGLYVCSHDMNVVGICDVVEFVRDNEDGCALSGEGGLWRCHPVEYKRGRPKTKDADRLQLCAQAMCLEEMLGCDIPAGSLYYGETQAREDVVFTDQLRARTRSLFEEMRALLDAGHTPKAKPGKACRSCSLRNECQPKAARRAKSAKAYVRSHLEEADDEKTA